MLDNKTGLFYIDNKVISLTFMEAKIFECLIHHKYRVSTYKMILKEVYNEDIDNYQHRNRIFLTMIRLIKKLEGHIEIRHIRNIGYALVLRWEKMDYEVKVNDIISKIKVLQEYYALGFITEKEYYKIYHRILDKIVSITEEEQVKCETEINKL